VSYNRVRFVVLVGKYGAGKTRIAKCLLDNFPHTFRLLTSNTTRPPKPEDLAGEYRYLTRADVRRLIGEGSLAWEPAQAAGNHYVTIRHDLECARADVDHVYLSILVPEVAQHLYDLYPDQVLVVWVSADDAVITERLLARGGNPEDIKKRQSEQGRWVEAFKAANYPKAVISNDSTPERAAGRIQELVWLRGD
jgi:guanylate kinase